jgi:hypothetical protein
MASLTAVVVALSMVGMAGAVSKGRLANPDAGLNDSQRLAKHAANYAAYEAKYDSWLRNFMSSGKDPRLLPRSHILALFEGPAPDLAEAVRRADLIVVGEAESVRFETGPLALVRFAVGQTLKGAAPAVIEVRQFGGPQPKPDFVDGFLAEADNAPILLPTDSAILFLRQITVNGAPAYYVQSYTGTYFLTNGFVRPLDGNPFMGQVGVEPAPMFTAAVIRFVH